MIPNMSLHNGGTQLQTFGINLIGNLTGGIGLSAASRAIANLLKLKEVPFSVYNVPYAWGSSDDDPKYADHVVTDPEQLVYPINLYVLPIALLPSFFNDNPAFLANECLQIINVWWEASRLPPDWEVMLTRFDGVLALSDFIAEVCRNSLPMTPTLAGQYPLDLPNNILQDRRKFGVPDEAVVFVASLDPNSDPARKNPEDLVTVFRAAFPVNDLDVRLVIRLNNTTTSMGQKVAQRLLELAHGDGRISLKLEPMSYDQVLSLYACADVYLSFHRGEGLGLGMLESMRLGKPVIATGWSGNLSFMNHTNSALLRYRLIPVSGHYEFFRPEVIGLDARWAEPIPEDTVAWMRQLRHNPALREKLGAKAKLSALEYHQRAIEARWLSELRELWQSQQYLSSFTAKLPSPIS